ncbi:helix-turn-helix transcriptional regulator [Sphaerisporangium sp. NPDC051017]|uniref:helix-turn-helix domain-containing protein n=1 Tax=Sphaerisporangium sp. NPDC051017 TaxID=3154636 RepID=UPI00341C0CAB
MSAGFTTTVRLRRLGAQLRRLREAQGLTLEEAGERMERSLSSLSKIETGRVAVRVRDLRVILDFYQVSDEKQYEWLIGLARDARKRGWWQQYDDVLSAAYQDFISLESDAAAVRTFETILIPGLLQTVDYARAVIEAVPAPRSRQDIGQLAKVRVERQEVLAREVPLQLWAIVDEAALHRHIGGRDTMRGQLHRLVEAARMEHVTLQVLPYTAGAHAGINGPFTILEFAEKSEPDVVLVENLTSGLYLEQEVDTRRFDQAFDHLRASALPIADSISLIERVIEDL